MPTLAGWNRAPPLLPAGWSAYDMVWSLLLEVLEGRGDEDEYLKKITNKFQGEIPLQI